MGISQNQENSIFRSSFLGWIGKRRRGDKKRLDGVVEYSRSGIKHCLYFWRIAFWRDPQSNQRENQGIHNIKL